MCLNQHHFVVVILTLSLFSSGIGWADEPLDKRFYLVPTATYDFFDSDSGIDDDYGYRLHIGKPLSDGFNLELTGFSTESSGVSGGDAELSGYGLNLLWFPDRYNTPFFGLLSVADAEYDGASTVNDSATVVEAGIGYIHPLTSGGGISLRTEYRYRNVSVSGVDRDSRDHVLMLGLEIPLGSRQTEQRTSPSDWRNPELAPLPVPAPEPCTDSDGDGVCDEDDECPDTEPGAAVLDNGCPLVEDIPLVLEGVEFEFDSARLRPSSTDILDQAVRLLDGTPDVMVEVAGHTDSIGTDAYNLKLSRARAKAVHDYLVDNGVMAERLTSQGYGESRPVTPNTHADGSDNPEGRARNRRVELNIIKQEN